jgi:hypothetical protein
MIFFCKLLNRLLEQINLMTPLYFYRHCEERSDVAIQTAAWIATSRRSSQRRVSYVMRFRLLTCSSVRQKVKPYFLPDQFEFEGKPSLPSNHVKATQNQSGLGVLLLFLPKKGAKPMLFAV